MDTETQELRTAAGVTELGQPGGLIRFTLAEPHPPIRGSDRAPVVTLEVEYDGTFAMARLDRETLASLASIAGYMATVSSSKGPNVKTLRIEGGDLTFELLAGATIVTMTMMVFPTMVVVYLHQDHDGVNELAQMAGYMATSVAG